MENVSKNISYQANPGCILREIAGENILIPAGKNDTDADRLFMLNETGLFLWNQMQTPKTIEQLVDNVKKSFDEKEEVLEKDIAEFIKNLLKRGFIRSI